MVSTQHSALSTQHSALSTQQYTLKHLTKSFFQCLFAILTLTGIASAAPNSCFIYSIDDPASGFNEWGSTRQEACQKYYKFVKPLDPNTIFYEGMMIRISDGGEKWTPVTDYDNFVSYCGVKFASIKYPLDYYYGFPKFTKWDYGSCAQVPTLIGYFNGVANTRLNAGDSLDRLRREYGAIYKSKPLTYDLFYNQTTCESGTFRVGKIPCLEDIAEVFEQRSNELNSALKNRWEHFWEMLSGRTSQDGSLTATLTSKLGKFGQAILQLLDNIYALIINQFVGSLPMLLNSLNGTPTLADNAVHVAKLKTYADKGSGMVLVAHSQGNLFVNAAYDGIKTAAPAAKVQVVHVAPASPTLRGGYALADVDYVIRTLRQLVTGLPSVNIELPLSANDSSGHSFEGTYLDVSRKAYERVKTMINTALDGV